jgi:hypothetical protein
MTAAALTQYLSRTVMVRFEEIMVKCVIIDAKNAYGNLRFRVEPVEGEGLQWVDAGRVLESPKIEKGN